MSELQRLNADSNLLTIMPTLPIAAPLDYVDFGINLIDQPVRFVLFVVFVDVFFKKKMCFEQFPVEFVRFKETLTRLELDQNKVVKSIVNYCMYQ
jgi:hypothetical protein